MVTDFPLFTLVSIAAVLITAAVALISIHVSRWGVFADPGVKASIWIFALSEILIAAYRVLRITLGDDALAQVPYWFFRDMAICFMILVICRYMYKHPNRRKNG